MPDYWGVFSVNDARLGIAREVCISAISRFRIWRRTFTGMGPRGRARILGRILTSADEGERRWCMVVALHVFAGIRAIPSIGRVANTRQRSEAAGPIADPASLPRSRFECWKKARCLFAPSLNGRAVDVAPDGFAHPVYRAGFALAVPTPRPSPAMPASRNRPAAEVELRRSRDQHGIRRCPSRPGSRRAPRRADRANPPGLPAEPTNSPHEAEPIDAIAPATEPPHRTSR